LKVLKVQK